MLPDKDSITISSTFDKEKSGAPEDRDISKDAKIEYTEKGFVITIPKLYRGEVATIKLTCTAKRKIHLRFHHRPMGRLSGKSKCR